MQNLTMHTTFDEAVSDGPGTVEERVDALEARLLELSSSVAQLTGLARWMTAAELARAEGWARVAESRELRNLLAALAPAAEPASEPRVASLACRKCGGPDVHLAYCDSSTSRTARNDDDACRLREPEHFHRTCRRCGYAWRSDDVLPWRAWDQGTTT